MLRLVCLLGLSLTLPAAAQDAAKPPLPKPGNYYLWYGANPTVKQRVAIVGIDEAGAVTLVASAPNVPPLKLGEVKPLDQGFVLPVELGTNKLSFESGPGPFSAGPVVGSFGDRDTVLRAALEPTDKAAIARDEITVREPPSPKIAETIKALNEVQAARRKAVEIEDAAERAKLLKEAEARQIEVEKQATEELRKIAQSDDAGAVAAAEALLGQDGDLPADELGQYAKLVADNAKRHGARFEAVTATRLANTLAQYGPKELALEYAKRATAIPGLSLKNRAGALRILAGVQRKAGMADELAATEQEMAKIEGELDAEYKKSVPPFEPTPFAGRKDAGADRVAVLELFTGAQCPPCVAADVAFDALIRAYPAQDVALLQYHLHIPGPDALTNPDSIARFDYYGKLFESDFGGTPSAAFDGKPAAGGGGGMAQSQAKFDQFTGLVNKSLETKSEAKIVAAARLDGDSLTGTVEVTVADPKETHKLRLILAEEEVKYVGSNGLRFHHHVVRSLLGTADGVPVKSLPDGKYELKASVAEVRKSLADYLANYQSGRGGFPESERPLELKNLRLYAIVQDDATGAILQAQVIPLGDAK